jgi:hypothetical protein
MEYIPWGNQARWCIELQIIKVEQQYGEKAPLNKR